MYRPSSGIHVSDQSISISRAEILMTFFLMNPMPPDFGCRSLRFKRSEGERAPQRYVFKEIYLPMGEELMTHDCRYECLIESNCLSVNIGPPNETGFRLCQLNTFDHTQHRVDISFFDVPNLFLFIFKLFKCGRVYQPHPWLSL